MAENQRMTSIAAICMSVCGKRGREERRHREFRGPRLFEDGHMLLHGSSQGGGVLPQSVVFGLKTENTEPPPFRPPPPLLTPSAH